MTEQWAITLATLAFALLSGLLGWIACEIRAMRMEMQQFVTTEVCTSKHGASCEKITKVESGIAELFSRVNKNSEDLSGIHAILSHLNL